MTHVVHGAGAFLRKAEGCRLPTKEITSPTGRSHPASSTFSSFSFAFAFSFAFTFLSFALTFLLFGFSGFAILKLCQKPGFLVCLKLTKGKKIDFVTHFMMFFFMLWWDSLKAQAQNWFFQWKMYSTIAIPPFFKHFKNGVINPRQTTHHLTKWSNLPKSFTLLGKKTFGKFAPC